MEDINTVGTTGKTVEQIASDWKNTKMTKFEIVKHFVEICKLDEEALEKKDQEIQKLQRGNDTLRQWVLHYRKKIGNIKEALEDIQGI